MSLPKSAGDVVRVFLLYACVSGLAGSHAAAQQNPDVMFRMMDANRDGTIARDEWRGPPERFNTIDADGDGFITLHELKAAAANAGGTSLPMTGRAQGPAGLSSPSPQIDRETMAAFLPRSYERAALTARGLLNTHLVPLYPTAAGCPVMDHRFGEPWQGVETPTVRNSDPMIRKSVEIFALHGGIDIPARQGTSIHAIADGTVIALFEGIGGFRGIEVILRHAPAETGLPVWIFTQYAHFAEMPALTLGQHVTSGDVLGPTGRTGVPGQKRESHLHLGAYFNDSGDYVIASQFFIPKNGHYMDPIALFRRAMPLDSHELLALSAGEKNVVVPYRLSDGRRIPEGTKVIWPFDCGLGQKFVPPPKN